MSKQTTSKILNSPETKRFLGAIHESATREAYLAVLQLFIESANAKKAKDLFGSTISIEKRIEKWIDDMKSSGVRGTTIKTRVDVIKLFYEMNRIAIAWKIIFKMVPKQVRLKDQGWSREQLQKMLTTAKIREQALIPLMASTGMRKGAVPPLNFGDFIPRDEWKIFEIIAYRGESEEYHTYCSPEAKAKMEIYWDFRRTHGEKITPDSPAFRLEWDVENGNGVDTPQRITTVTIDAAVKQVVVDAGLRTPVKVKSLAHAGRVRHPQKLLHGIRKFFETVLLDAGFDDNWLDMIEGHKLKGLRENYYRPKDDTVLVGVASADGKIRKPGYVDLMRELVINDEERAKVQVKELQKKLVGEEHIMKEIESLKRHNRRLEGLLDPDLKKATKQFSVEDPLQGNFGAPRPTEENNEEDASDSRSN